MLCSPTHHRFTNLSSEPVDKIVRLRLINLLWSTTAIRLKCFANAPAFMMALG